MLTVADPLSRLLDLAEQVPSSSHPIADSNVYTARYIARRGMAPLSTFS